MYVGWGLKELSKPFAPAALPEVQKEYGAATNGDDVQEKNDPTVEEEQAFNDANKKDGDKDGDGDEEEEEEA